MEEAPSTPCFRPKETLPQPASTRTHCHLKAGYPSRLLLVRIAVGFVLARRKRRALNLLPNRRLGLPQRFRPLRKLGHPPKTGLCITADALRRGHGGAGVLDTERVLEYADRWRMLARGWARMAGKEDSPHATRLRHSAQMALFAAFEAEQLFRARDHRPKQPASVAAPRRHGPIRYDAAMGPVSLAGQRSRSGPYAGRRAARLG